MRRLIASTGLAALLACSVAHAAPIHDAAKAGKLDEVSRLLAKDPSLIHAKDERGLTPLHYACSTSVALVNLLLAKGADVNAQSLRGATPLSVAARFGKLDIARVLLAHHADVNADGPNGTALEQAVYRSPLPLVQLLLDHGANPNLADRHGQTAMHVVATWNADKAARLLLLHHADVNARDENGNTPLHETLEFAGPSSVGSLDTARLLIAHHASLAAKNNAGQTPLALAKAKGAKKMVELLLAAGAKE